MMSIAPARASRTGAARRMIGQISCLETTKTAVLILYDVNLVRELRKNAHCTTYYRWDKLTESQARLVGEACLSILLKA